MKNGTNYSIGKNGRIRETYLKEYRKVTYKMLWMECKLNEHLHDIDVRATEEVDKIVAAMTKADGTNEELKMAEQMEWVGRMNNYRHCAEEIVFKEVVYN